MFGISEIATRQKHQASTQLKSSDAKQGRSTQRSPATVAARLASSQAAHESQSEQGRECEAMHIGRSTWLVAAETPASKRAWRSARLACSCGLLALTAALPAGARSSLSHAPDTLAGCRQVGKLLDGAERTERQHRQGTAARAPRMPL